MYKLVAIGGTFDRLHKGHQYFLNKTFELGDKVFIGLTSDEYIKENLKFKMQNAKLQIKIKKYEYRKRELEGVLGEMGLLERVEIVKIDDVYGPAVESRDIEALIVTQETLNGAQMINRKREKQDLSPFKVVEVKMIKADDERPISSTRIRLGEIDRWGKVFSRVKINSPISTELRMKLKIPIGVVIPGNSDNLEFVVADLKKRLKKLDPVMLLTVGDEVTKIANKTGFMPDLAVIDFLVGRIQKYSDIKELYYDKLITDVKIVKNSPGHISSQLINSIYKAIQETVADGKKRIVRVKGEEDLAGVPALLLAPLGSVLLYGQPAYAPTSSGLRRGEPALIGRGKPRGGVVVVEVTEEKKKELVKLIELRGTN